MTHIKTGRRFVPYTNVLKKLGFEFEFDSHGGGCRQIQFSCEYPKTDRYIWVDLSYWPNGTVQMRLGRGNLTSLGRNSSIREHGYPVEFTNVEGMLIGIIWQLTEA